MKKEIVIQGKAFCKPVEKGKGKTKNKKKQREQPKSFVRL